MSSQHKQMAVMIATSLRSIPRRIWISASMVVSVALVVCVLVGFLAMAKGFEAALAAAGSRSIAVVLGGGTNQELGSEIPAEAIRTLAASRGDIGLVRDARGTPVLSRELVVPIDLRRVSDGVNQTLTLRGMDVAGPGLRDGVTIGNGRVFAPGSREIVVGARIAREYMGSAAAGQVIRIGAVDWTIAGIFEAGGSAFESEIWADLEAVQSAFDRQGQVQTVRARLLDPARLDDLRAALPGIARTPLVAVSEAQLYLAQSEQTSGLIRLFGWPLAILMAIGAVAGALNTMMSSVSDRAVEIATLRALGFSRLSAFTGTWAEALFLAAIGCALGAVASWALFNGWQASTLGANNTQMAFQLRVSADVLLAGGLLGLGIGIVGGGMAALAATRIPLVAALRARG